MSTLKVSNLHVNVGEKEILKGINIEIKTGEIHAIMGPNGNGKSTLLSAIMGHPKYTVTQGSILLDDQDVLAMSVDERSRAGLFLGMQYPQEIPGVTNSDFLKAAMNARLDKPVSLFKFIRTLDKNIEELHMDENLAHRYLNEGFSGGEKKRNEILQMLLLKPDLAMLDEIDSGLDVDAINVVANAINELESTDMSFLVISHYARLYQLIHPTRAAIMINGKIVLEGDNSLIKRIDIEGYEWLRKEYGIKITKDETEMNTVSIGSCAVKNVLK